MSEVATREEELRYSATYSGQRIVVTNVSGAVYKIEDIARGLSNMCRFGGQIEEFYSVAEHCVRGSYLAERKGGLLSAIEFLLHDAAEAYVGDLVSPFLTVCPDYKKVRDEIQEAIEWTFQEHTGAGLGQSALCKEIDMVMLVTEARDLMNPVNPWWEAEGFPRPHKDKLYLIGPTGWGRTTYTMPGSRFWSPHQAFRAFSVRYTDLAYRIEKAQKAAAELERL